MTNGWPHTGDGQGIPSANRGQAPFGPEVSWPHGYPQTGHPAQPPAAQGAHPYAGFNPPGYGDDGYRDPDYQAPGPAGYGQPGYPQAPGRDGYGQPGYPAGQTPASADQYQADQYQSADLYNQPWDYEQPLRYEGEEDAYSARNDSRPAGDFRPGQRRPADSGEFYQAPVYDPAAYNGSDYSMPGIHGAGYDLTGIIGTSDFEAVGYDEPSYGRLSYDDPRYADPSGHAGSRPNFGDETRFDVPRFDETRMDNLWLAGDDVRRDGGPADLGNGGGFGNGGGSGERRARSDSGSFAAADRGRDPRAAQTRYDLQALVEPGDATRFDVPAFDETRIENLRALTPGGGLRMPGGTLLAPPAARPRGWADETSLDHFADLDLTDEPVPAAFTRTLDRPRPDDTGARRAAGRRRGRSGDRRQWMALGAIAVVAAGAIGGVLMKYVFSGPSGPGHQVSAPQKVEGYARSANLEKQLGVGSEAAKVARASEGQASSVVSAVYQQGSIVPGSNAQIFMFVGGKLAGADPAASVANFEQTYPGSQAVSAGSLGGEAACSETHLNGQSASMCVWFDNDTFGTVVSPTMTTAKLAATMAEVRPSLELLQQ